MKHQDAPGTTFKRHLAIARGLMSEDDFLISEILFNPNTPEQLSRMQRRLAELKEIIDRRDTEAMKAYLDRARANIV
jgi:prephenate dehydrogenase